jgi:hypothetical protein
MTPTIQGVGGRFARTYGSPGQRARLVGLAGVAWPFFVAAAATGYLVRAAIPSPRLTAPAAGLGLILLGVALAVIARFLRPRLEAFVKGAQGEEWVARELTFLPSSYQIFHGLVLPGRDGEPPDGDVDHVVVGPTGVFVVETKNWSGHITVEQGRILYDGKQPDRPPLEQVRQRVESLRRILKKELGADVEVSPILCFATNTLDGKTQGVGGVVVCNARYLPAVIEDSMERPMDAARAERIGDCLRRILNPGSAQ